MPGVNQVTVYLDESYNSTYYIVGGVVATGTQITEIENKWKVLQEEIRDTLISEYPLARKNKKFLGGELPEIKGNSLFKSSGYYSKNDSGKSEYWKQQWDWLERAYAIGAESGVLKVAIMLPPGRHEKASITGKGYLSEMLSIGAGIPSSVKATMNRIELDRHSRIVSMIYPAIGRILEMRGEMANIIWDEHSLGNVISQLTTPRLLRSRGLFGRILDNQFLVSENTPMLQLADVVAYVLRIMAEKQYGTAGKDAYFIEEMVEKYSFTPHPVPDHTIWEVSLCRLLAVEMVMIGSGGPADYQTLRDENLSDLLEYFFQIFQQDAFHEERARDAAARAAKPSIVNKVKKMFSGKGARTQIADSHKPNTNSETEE